MSRTMTFEFPVQEEDLHTKIIKRNGAEEIFDLNKIKMAVTMAIAVVDE